MVTLKWKLFCFLNFFQFNMEVKLFMVENVIQKY